MAGGHNVRPTSWLAVGVIIAGAILLGFALPVHSLLLAVAGGVLVLVGLVAAAAFRIMDDAY